MSLNRQSLRTQLRARRNALSAVQQARAARDLLARLQTLPLFVHARSLALYFANDGEIDPAEVLRWSLAHGKRCYAPVIVGGADANSGVETPHPMLRFGEITACSKLKNNRFGIAEPVTASGANAARELIPAEQIEVLLLPLVGFDRDGNRLGMGGGFYDATLAFKKTALNESDRPPHLIGLAHDLQRVLKIDAQNWDIPLCAVVTDAHVYHCREGVGPTESAKVSQTAKINATNGANTVAKFSTAPAV